VNFNNVEELSIAISVTGTQVIIQQRDKERESPATGSHQASKQTITQWLRTFITKSTAVNPTSREHLSLKQICMCPRPQFCHVVATPPSSAGHDSI